MLTIGYLWEKYEKFWFFIMCHDWLNVSGHSLLKWNVNTDVFPAVTGSPENNICSLELEIDFRDVKLLFSC